MERGSDDEGVQALRGINRRRALLIPCRVYKFYLRGYKALVPRSSFTQQQGCRLNPAEFQVLFVYEKMEERSCYADCLYLLARL
jgi:hypothetical protein